MKKKLSILFSLLYVFTLFGCCSEKFIAYEDEHGHVILSGKDPYFYYMEKYDSYISKDDGFLKDVVQSIYISDENKDFEISNYKDGICINGYVGDDVDIVIPEYIDDKKVLKIGSAIIETEDGESLMCVSPFYDEYREFELDTIYVPSGVKEISFASLDFFKKIVVDKNNPYYYSVGGVLFSRKTKRILLIPYQFFYYRSVDFDKFSLSQV